MLRKGKVVFFDIDGTLTVHNTNGWIKISEIIGGEMMVKEHFNNFMQWRNKELTTELFLEATCKMWQRNPHNFMEILEELQPQFRDETVETLKELQGRGSDVVLVSSAYLPYVKQVGEKLGIEKYFANGDILTDENHRILEIINFAGNETELKLEQVRNHLQMHELEAHEAWFVGNDKNDLLALEHVGRGFLIGDLEIGASEKITRIESLSEVHKAISFNDEINSGFKFY
jgi:HAD superfamily phosphoserine phosphatase-like hydrolase